MTKSYRNSYLSQQTIEMFPGLEFSCKNHVGNASPQMHASRVLARMWHFSKTAATDYRHERRGFSFLYDRDKNFPTGVGKPQWVWVCAENGQKAKKCGGRITTFAFFDCCVFHETALLEGGTSEKGNGIRLLWNGGRVAEPILSVLNYTVNRWYLVKNQVVRVKKGVAAQVGKMSRAGKYRNGTGLVAGNTCWDSDSKSGKPLNSHGTPLAKLNAGFGISLTMLNFWIEETERQLAETLSQAFTIFTLTSNFVTLSYNYMTLPKFFLKKINTKI